MKIISKLALVITIVSLFVVTARGRTLYRTLDEAAGREYIRSRNEWMSQAMNKKTIAAWNYESNITEHTAAHLLQVSLELAKEEKIYWKETMSYPWQEYEDEDLKKMFKAYSSLGTSALPEDLNARLINAISHMKSNYDTATMCDYRDRTKCDLGQGRLNIFANGNDLEELKYTWLEWHRVAGAPSKDYFTEYVQIYNKAAKLNGYDSVAEWWLSGYGSDSEYQFASLWTQIKPLYQQIHAYVRRLLRLKYGESVVPARGPIPAHLLGSVWGVNWVNVEKFTKPYPYKAEVDITAALQARNYTALRMFQTAEEFFTSMNMTPMPVSFWEKSIIEMPDDGRNINCHPTAWDFYDGEDFRIKQCTGITDTFFKITHHEMGHIQYYLQYKDQPILYRNGANLGFHEAVGEVIALSVATPKHLRVIGLLEDGSDDLESNINQLYKMSLEKVVFMPFAYLLDSFRYSAFRGTSTPENYNCHFWQLKESLQGIEPPGPRSEDDFDVAAMYHISADLEYMRYFVAHIIQFQFHRALCQIAGEYAVGDSNKLLSNCDIYRSTEAGDAFAKMLQLGASKPWPEAMEVLTGQRNMDASAILEYFQPLYEWLQAENERTNEFIGWVPSTVPYCTAEQRTAMETSGFYKRLIK